MVQSRTYVLLVAFACLLTLFLPFCVPSVESKEIAPDGGSSDPPPQLGGSEEGGDPDDIAVNSPIGDIGIGGWGMFRLGDEGSVIVWTEEYAVSREEQVVDARRENAWLLWLVLRLTRQFPFIQ